MNYLDPVVNLLESKIAVAPDPASSGTEFTVTTGEGSLFPDPNVAEYNLVIHQYGVETTRSNSTIVRVTAKSGDVFTVTRDVEDSASRDIIVGDAVSMNITAKMITDIDTVLSNKLDTGTTTADIADSNDKRYVTDADITLLGNTSGTNTGDQDLSGLVAKSTFDANTLLKADVDNTPTALTILEQTVLGRATGGVITGLTIDSDLASTSASDDTIPSAKAAKAYADTKLAKATDVTSINDTGIADGEIPVFNKTNKDIRTSDKVFSTDNTLAGNSDSNVPTEKAVKGYVDTRGSNSLQRDCSGGTSDTYGALSGLLNGSNTVYTVSLGSYISGSLKVWLNGQLQTQGSSEDWVETTPGSGTFTFATAPASTDVIIVEYQYSSGATGNSDTLDGLHGSSYALNSEWVSGWKSVSDTWTYASADAPTFVITVPSGAASRYSVGMKIKLTQTTVKYFIITAISDTTITVYGGTDYTLVDAAISANYYSMVKSPLGFPMSPLKWEVKTNLTGGSQATPTSSTWYNVASNLATIPIGVWNIRFKGDFAATGSGGFLVVYATLSTANNTKWDDDLTVLVNTSAGITQLGYVTLSASKTLTMAAKTNLYLNLMTNSANTTNIYITTPACIWATSAYL